MLYAFFILNLKHFLNFSIHFSNALTFLLIKYYKSFHQEGGVGLGVGIYQTFNLGMSYKDLYLTLYDQGIESL